MVQTIADIVRAAGQIILQADADKHVRRKSSKHDLVTRYDTQVQEFLCCALLDILPGAGFYGEEDDGDAVCLSGLHFIVDPIDGTTNFIKGLRRSCVSVALADGERIALGVIYNPYTDEMFTAEAGKGAFLNGEPIHASRCGMDEAVVYAGASPYYPACYDETFHLARSLMGRCVDIRRSGSAALELCDVACGRAEAYFEALLSPWDYAAGSLIVQEAGGFATDIAGKPLQFAERSSLAAANPACFDELLRLAREAETC